MNAPFQLLCRSLDSLAKREMSIEKNVDLKSMQANGLESVTGMAKRGGRILTD